MKRIIIVIGLLILSSASVALSLQTPAEQPTLVLYSTLGRLLGGEVTGGVTPAQVREDLSIFPESWSVVGIGTSNQPMRNGELIPDGTVGDLNFWWVDPSSEGHNHLTRLVDDADAASTPEPGAVTATVMDFDGELPFVALSVADASQAITLTAKNIDNIHVWLTATLQEKDISVAGVQLQGAFGPVKTTIGYNLPPEGLNINDAYMTSDHFHAAEYEPATWVMNGIYATDPEVEPLVIAPNQYVHLHGYQPEAGLGGHITSAQAIDVSVTVYPLEAVIQKLPAEATPEP